MSTIDELRGLVERASKGPWKAQKDDLLTAHHTESMRGFYKDYIPESDTYSVNDDHGVFVCECGNHARTKPNADLIVAAVSALPALLAVAEAAREIKNCGSMLSMQGPWDRLHKALARLDGEVGHG